MKSKIKLRKIKIDQTGFHLLVKVKLNSKPALLVLDTGASQTVLDYHIASAISKNKAKRLDDASSTGVGGEQLQSHLLKVEKFHIGNVIVHDSYFVLLDLQHVNAQYERIGKIKIQGVLGGDILNAFGAVIDYKKSELVLSYRKSG
ncbi:MAG: retropepsin-like aspartic protease [Bacteroidia bacterium]